MRKMSASVRVSLQRFIYMERVATKRYAHFRYNAYPFAEDNVLFVTLHPTDSRCHVTMTVVHEKDLPAPATCAANLYETPLKLEEERQVQFWLKEWGSLDVPVANWTRIKLQ